MNRLWSEIRYRVRALLRRDRMERELDAELQFHLERETEELQRRGLTREQALRQARVAFGGVEQAREQDRDARGIALLEAFVQDLRYAARSLRKNPLFAVTVVAILAIGIGANTATFTVIDALLLRPLPVPHPEQLVIVGEPNAVGGGWHGSPSIDYASYPVYADVRDRNHVLSGIFASGWANRADVIVDPIVPGTARATEHPRVRLVTGTFFSVLQVPAALGRTFGTAEDRINAAVPVAVISDRYWQARLGHDPSAIGRQFTVNDIPLSIVGVMPRGFDGEVVGQTTDIWIPMSMQPVLEPKRKLLDDRHWSWLQIMGRLAPGVTLAQARAELGAIEMQSIRAHAVGDDLADLEADLKEHPILVTAGARGFSRYRRDYGPALAILMTAVTLVILIVCANVANLMIVRGVSRAREITVRMSLGAGRARLVRQLLTECVLIAILGGGVGLFVADAGSRLLLSLAGEDGTPIPLDVRPDLQILAFSAGVTLLSAILVGLMPALRTTRVDVATALRAQGRTLLGARAKVGGFALGKLLVVVQVGLSAVLLIGAGLLLRSMHRLLDADLGFDRDHVVLVHVAAEKSGYDDAHVPALINDLSSRLRQVPGVSAVSYTLHGVFTGTFGAIHVEIPGFTPASYADAQTFYDSVGPDYFQTLGAHLVSGRDFDARDVNTSAKVAIINTTVAKAYFRGVDPIGRAIREKDGDNCTVVGVVGDIEERSIRGEPSRHVYFSLLQRAIHPSVWMAVRVATDPRNAISGIRQAVLDVNRNLSFEISPVGDLVRSSVADDRLTANVTTAFGVVALLLAAFGLYGVTAYATSQRTGEFGLRVALGAHPASVARMIIAEASGLVAVGIVLGVPAGLAASRFIRGQIFGVSALDPLSLAGAVTALAAAALVASYVPAWRASRVDPIEALRVE